MKVVIATILLLALLTMSARGEEGFVVPGDNMTLDGIPPIPLAVAANADRYLQFRTARFAQWHPQRLEMLITTRFADTAQVHRVRSPGAAREQLTFFDEPVAEVPIFEEDGPRGEYFTFARDVGGDEFFQLYRFDIATGLVTLLTDGVKRNDGGVLSAANGLLAYLRLDSDEQGAFSEIHIVDPAAPDSDRRASTLRGLWLPLDWSPDGESLLVMEYISINDSRIALLDPETGATRRLLPAEAGAPVAHRAAVFSRDGRGIYVDSDAGREFRTLEYVDLETLETVALTEGIDWDVENFDLSSDGKHLAFSVNAAGESELYVLDTATRSSTRVASAPRGVIGNLDWHNDSEHLAFSLSSASVPGDVFVLDAASGEIVRWTYSETGGIDTSAFPPAELIEWQSFDGLTVSAFLYRPPARFTGKRPVLMLIHGGPEGQSRPGYRGNFNYLLNELGVALLYPNVRGSAGYGKSFLLLDNGTKREGTYEDIGSLLDWIAEQGDLDASRVMVYGGSYGGHMTLATATRYSDRISCSVNLYGISDLRTFLQNTEGYRRDLRRAEYGDERDPATREWMERTAPMTLVANVDKPMLVQQGVNDPRVPKSESDQIVATLKAHGVPTWYLVFDDEGHGFRKKPNVDMSFYTTITFADQCLLH